MSVRHVSGTQLARLLGELPQERPFYAALARAVRGLVLNGRLPLRVRLPAERDLAAALGISRTTVTAAYDRLRDEGYVESRQGAGSWTALPRAERPAARQAVTRFGIAHTADGGWPHEEPVDLGCAAPAAPAVFDDAVAEAVAELPRHAAGPGYEPAGLVELREAVAARYTELGAPTRPDQIMVTTGAQQAISLLTQTLLDPGDAVLVERPTYPHALDAVRRRGARLVPVGVTGGWDLDLLAGSMRQAAVRMAYTIPDFQNPTGHLLDDAGRTALIEAARAADAFLVVDETFAELAHDPAAPRPRPVAAHDTGGRVISIGSASKLLWGGLRIGWIRATAPLVRRLAMARESVDIAGPVLEQLITWRLMPRIEDVRAERAATLTRNRDALVAALRELLPEWEFTVPDGGMTLWARLGAPVATSVAEAAWRHGVRVTPGPVFGVDGVLEDCLRLPYVLDPRTLRTAVERLARACHEAETAPIARPLPAYV
ncbi:DNA-binding transcriptional regulator, MocR family, contains an aminotransferase domain [Thermomonospora echinospora]|uniref:DNA-binding transcriptional regulator, MocR family, contains an aminotransferase domain n=1 Tax=Thermomonospora echinospora TaxID=1992 RepID=A0A1H6BY58_9ACTN|nr:PLP-dependent aminotransferase family protein [Thermomonospora echinospora]SEG65592.1 DNA-binding transcriptional regulator, MocR family, contains an aminotransferase domain [Thermomonospora echinospora]